ncbi:GNAT family N-acetyltransferase [Sphingomonas rhizophila]|uniref:GNAT family N-acetyltransferase n=2 Tax=Sphingomonas rhizophila TaxID=2071607 RepID=A0A7G9SEG6_9SPHN|nr:GNAT family N-acetyltransferase [Sphingomonas rhizophila]
MEPLDRPIWFALQDRQRHFAIGDGLARRFQPDVSPFIACADDSREALAAVSDLLGDRDAALFMQRTETPIPPGTVRLDGGRGVQMVSDGLEPVKPPPGVVALTDADAPAMLALAALTEPGPFRRRTHELSQFFGFKDKDGRLLAMAGERLKLPGMSEVSAVCTHPDAHGRGLAEQMTRYVAGVIAARGETPFLHTYADNAAAIRIYERIGFRHRCFVEVTVIGRA